MTSALLAGLGLVAWLPGSVPGRRLANLAGRRGVGSPRPRPWLPDRSLSAVRRLALGSRDRASTKLLGAAALAAVSAGLVVGSPGGIPVALGVGAGLTAWLHRLEPVEVRRRRERLAAAAPLLADLVAACLAAGCPVVLATSAVAEALGDPVRQELTPVLAATQLGTDPATAWATLQSGPLEPFARVVARSARTGSSPLDGLASLAADVRASARSDAEARARATGARAAAPLGLCLLPAFVLCGVVPLVAGLVAEVLA